MAQESWGFWVGTSNRLREAPLKRIVGALLASAVLASSAFASGRQDDITRTRKAAEVFKQIWRPRIWAFRSSYSSLRHALPSSRVILRDGRKRRKIGSIIVAQKPHRDEACEITAH